MKRQNRVQAGQSATQRHVQSKPLNPLTTPRYLDVVVVEQFSLCRRAIVLYSAVMRDQSTNPINYPTQEEIESQGEELGQSIGVRDKWGFPIKIGMLTLCDRVDKRSLTAEEFRENIMGRYRYLRNAVYNLKCSCGRWITADRTAIRLAIQGRGRLYSCGCTPKPQSSDLDQVLHAVPVIDLRGRQFGRLVPERYYGPEYGWLCLCLLCAEEILVPRGPAMSYRTCLQIAGRCYCPSIRGTGLKCVSPVKVPILASAVGAYRPPPPELEPIPDQKPYVREEDTFVMLKGNLDWDLVEEPEYSGNYVYVHKETGERRAIEW
jgi:hypothetical protein